MLRAALLAAGLTAVTAFAGDAAFAGDTKTEAVGRDTTKTEVAPRRSLEEFECIARPGSPGWETVCARFVKPKPDGRCDTIEEQGNCMWVPKLAERFVPADAGTKMTNIGYLFSGFVLFPAKRSVPAKRTHTGRTLMPLYYVRLSLRSRYDVMYGNPDGHDEDLPGFRQPVFDAIYSSPPRVTAGSEQILQPDGVTISQANVCSTSTTFKDYAGQKAYHESLGVKVSVEGSGWGASFSASSDYKTMTEGDETSRIVITTVEASCSVYKAALSYSRPKLSPAFLTGLASLPEAWGDAYVKFVEAFGTHYLTEITMGARSGESSRFSAETYEQLQTSGVNISAAASYSFLGASASAGVDTAQAKRDKNSWQSADKTSIRFSVGASLPKAGEDPAVWAQTIHDSPMPIKYKLKEIATLVENHSDARHISATVKTNLKMAMYSYCTYLVWKKEIKGPCSGPVDAVCPTAKPIWSTFGRQSALASGYWNHRDVDSYNEALSLGYATGDKYPVDIYGMRPSNYPGSDLTPYYSLAEDNPMGDLVPIWRCTGPFSVSYLQTKPGPRDFALDSAGGQCENTYKHNGGTTASNYQFSKDRVMGYCSPGPKPGLVALLRAGLFVQGVYNKGAEGRIHDRWNLLDSDKDNYVAAWPASDDWENKEILCYVAPGQKTQFPC